MNKSAESPSTSEPSREEFIEALRTELREVNSRLQAVAEKLERQKPLLTELLEAAGELCDDLESDGIDCVRLRAATNAFQKQNEPAGLTLASPDSAVEEI